MIIESNFVQAKSREKAEVLYICVSFWLLAHESHDFSQVLNLRQNQLLLQAKNLEEKDGQRLLLCYGSLIRACNKVL